MPKMTVRVILKSGVEFSIKCDKFTLTRNGFQQVTGYNIEGITENQPVYLDFEQVAAVVRVFSDEKEMTHDEHCFTYPSADGCGIFSRLYLRESGNPLRARAATVHGRRRERRRSRALPFNGSYL